MSTTSAVVDVDEVTKRLNIRQLKERAQAAVAGGRLTQAAVDAADDHDEGEKFQLRRLVLEAAIGPDRMAALRAMKVKALKALAAEVGADTTRIENAAESETPKDDLAAMIIEKELPVRLAQQAAKEAAASKAEPVSKWTVGASLGGQESIFEATDNETNEAVVAKKHTHKAQFTAEWERLKGLMQDRDGRKRVMQLKGVDEQKMLLFLEKASGSLDLTLEHEPQGLSEAVVKPWIQKAIEILIYFHNSVGIVHNDFKAANLLIFGDAIKPELKAGDMESATKIGAVRNSYVSATICTPELAKQLTGGYTDELKVAPAEDIWALGVVTLRLLTGAPPFGDSVERIAALTQADVFAVLLKAGAKAGTPLERFLDRCLQIEPHNRADINSLKASGWISGNMATQNYQAEKTSSAKKLDTMMEKLEEVDEHVQDVGEQLQDRLDSVLQAIEIVRSTIVNLDSCPIPTSFVVELEGNPSNQSGWKLSTKAAAFEEGAQFQTELYDPTRKTAAIENTVKDKKLRLRLICQFTGRPVGDGYAIKDPTAAVPKLLPLMHAGVRTMTVLSGVLQMGRMFGLPTAGLPDKLLKKAENAVKKMATTGAEFSCVAEIAGDAVRGSSSAAKGALSRFQQQEFAVFLREHDPSDVSLGCTVASAIASCPK